MPRLWKFTELIDTDVLAPGLYMKSPLAELATHCLGAIRPEFADAVRPGDVMLSGPNMGVGSSREQAAEVLKFLGIKAVVAPSFAGIFYRNAINLGLPAFTISPAAFAHPKLEDGASVRFTFDTAELVLADHGVTIELEPLPQFLREMILDGGLVPHLEKRFLADADEREK
ncbi:MAG: 3-isopropylmalate dehydratase [Proteobacteria bacterium]|jgi:3-isopropylmalate/(R)-2-methylmalate dehydratase small subunit|nr:3-isopropylmalate dehydratase [Pseudomonadota bacterium]MDA1149167.1 3-isopropylmalate dehydratase [Pseudomonadota bacterium]